MPKETFLNLKEEKQQRILSAALHEIAENGYDKASVTRIVKDAGIATGSFYQYFEDLDDLFIHIALEAGRIKAAYMRKALAESKEQNLEGAIRAMYLGGMRFGLEHKEYYKAAESLMRMKDSELYHKMLAHAEKSELALWLFQIVAQAIANGELNENITPELFFRLLTGINATIIEYLIEQKPDEGMDALDLEKLCELGVQLVLHGIKR
ncbi:MAG TPA: TetR/AcrR family transcriptional regulator [Candidatus Limiplasma sp.]|nr:TetR/AcrR family transcriptional regulator [Candidatus Limiplasma sp.]HRX09519.1 TetR/AcrR family transcriptional regulator [Candidatus Limiplasma sp.]